MEIFLSVLLSLVTTVAVIAVSWGKLRQGFDDLKERFDKFEDRIGGRIDKISDKVSGIEGELGLRYKTVKSPIRLTQEGEQVLSESSGKGIVDDKENKKILLDKILSDPRPTNAYDAHEKTRDVIKNMANDPMFSPLKAYAFDKGKNLKNLLDIVGIYFRDCVLEKLDFKEEELDKHSEISQ